MRGAAVATALFLALAPVAAHAGDGGGGGGGGGDQLNGVIESLPATAGFIGDWVVSGTIVHVTTGTEIDQSDAPVAVGANVDVEGSAATDGSITASQISVTQDSEDDSGGEAELHGTVQSLPAAAGFVGDWVVSGITVHVTSSTEIDAEDGTIAVGSFVDVQGSGEADGSITATQIDLQNDQGDDENGDGTLTGTLDHEGDSPGIWTVSGHSVIVTRQTRIVRHGHALHHGSRLRVVGRWRPNGSLRASRIVVKS